MTAGQRIRRLVRRARPEAGQSATEYAIFTSALVAGSGVSLLVFMPNAIASYKLYILSFYVILGLPFP
jgi:hypothetical protein